MQHNNVIMGLIYVNMQHNWRRSEWALVPQAEGLVFEFQPRQTLVVKAGSDSSTAKRSAIAVGFTGPRRWPL